MTITLAQLRNTFPRAGTLRWIGLRPARDKATLAPPQAIAVVGRGLEGDRHAAKRSDRRCVTLIQHEHLPVIAAMSGRDETLPADLRRNLVISGINLLATKEVHLRIGEVILEMTGLCHPCSKMETRLGPGGYNAMRGHGGITARIIQGGVMSVGDNVIAFLPEVAASDARFAELHETQTRGA
jgi:MOSC domain-containing protein YiiM